MNPFEAGQQLGSLLFGQQPGAGDPNGEPNLFDAVSGAPRQGGIYYRTLTQGAQAQNVMQEARINRAKALIQESMLQHRRAVTPQAMQTLGYSPQSAAALGDILLSSAEPDIRRFGPLANPNAVPALGQAATDMQAGDFPGYNEQTALAEGKPYQPVIVAGDTLRPSGVPLGDSAFQMVTTPTGQATIGEKNALAGAAEALIKERDARTAAGFTKKGSKAPKPATPTKTLLETLLPPEDTANGPAPLDVPRAMRRYEAAVADGAITIPEILAWSTAHPAIGNDTGGTPTGMIYNAPEPAPAAEPSLGDAATIPPGVQIKLAPGTDPRIVAAVQAAARTDPAARSAVATPTSQAEFDALPAGAMFVNPSDGKTYRKK